MSIRTLQDMKHHTFSFAGEYATIFGTPERAGTWLIYGEEKQGKTWAALILANYLSQFAHVLYVSAEEGFSLTFVDAVRRAGIAHTNRKLHVTDGSYPLYEVLQAKCGARKKTRIVFIDNITFYKDELKGTKMQHLQRSYPDVLFIYLAHEDNGRPYGATAQMCKRLSKIIIHVEGLQAQISGRCPGGTLTIHDTKAQLYWGATNPQESSTHNLHAI